MIVREWVKLPVGWIEGGGLRALTWKNGGSAHVAGILVLFALAHLADETGVARATYTELETATSLSRTKIAHGLKMLAAKGLVTGVKNSRSTYLIQNYDAVPWGKLPAKGMYREGVMTCFSHFTLRNSMELRALKILILLIARRDNRTNLSSIGYDAISQSTGISKGNIKAALNILVLNNIVHIEKIMREGGRGYYNAYRISHVEPYRHMGTIGYSGGISEVSM